MFIEVFIYCVIASIMVKYIYKVDWLTVIKLCVCIYIAWLLLVIILA